MKSEITSLKVLLILTGVSLVTLASCEEDDMDPGMQRPANVVEVIAGSNNHTTLAAAVSAAGLIQTLQGAGPFTVFAPTDAAFAALPAGTLETLLAEPSGTLTDILLYHVVEGRVMSGSLSSGIKATTVFGQELTVTVTGQGVFINDARVTVADIETENGVVHVINAVLLPETTPDTVIDIVMGSEDHTTLAVAVEAAELVETLRGEGPFTLFAPTNAAFSALPDGTVEALLENPTGDLAEILKYHVVAARALSTDLSNGQEITTVHGHKLTVTINAEGVFINNAKVIAADLEAGNGVVHVIDGVLLP
jgi:uncharacterized surface protein with fasciclin (FAS1) repeats